MVENKAPGPRPQPALRQPFPRPRSNDRFSPTASAAPLPGADLVCGSASPTVPSYREMAGLDPLGQPARRLLAPSQEAPGARGLQQAHRCPSCFISLAAWKTFPLGSARTSQPVFHAPPFLPIAPLLANHHERGCSGVSGRPPALFSPLTPASPVTPPLSAVTLLPRSPLRRAPSPGSHLRASVPVLVAPLSFLCVLSPGSSRPELLSAIYMPMTCTSVSSPASSPEPRAPGPTPRQHHEADFYSTLHTHLKLRHTLSPLLSRQLLVLQFPPPQYMAP